MPARLAITWGSILQPFRRREDRIETGMRDVLERLMMESRHQDWQLCTLSCIPMDSTSRGSKTRTLRKMRLSGLLR